MPNRMRSPLPAPPAVVLMIAVGTGFLGGAPAAQSKPAEPTLDQVVARMSRCVADYGDKASLIVAIEKYQQNVSTQRGTLRARRLTAEFAVVRADGEVGWVGFRDVVEVDGKEVTDRADRLRQLFTGSSFNASAVAAISNESARYDIGLVIRNINVPTT